MDQERCDLELEMLPDREAVKKALSLLRKVSPATGTAICKPDGISLQVLPEQQNSSLLCAILQIDPGSVNRFRCSRSITAPFQLDYLHFILNFAPEGSINVTMEDFDDEEVGFSYGGSERNVFRTRDLSRVSNEHCPEIAIDDSDFEYAVVVGIASEDFRRIIRHFKDMISPFVEAFVTDEEVTFRFGPEEIVLKPEDGNCLIWGINGYPRVKIRINLQYPDSLLEASELYASVWMLKSRNWPDLIACPVQQLGSVRFYFKNEYMLP